MAFVVRVVALSSAAALLFWLCYVPFRCNRTIKRIHVLSTNRPPMVSEAAARTLTLRNIAGLERDCRGCRNVNVGLLLAYNADAAGDIEGAIRYLDRAISIEPRPEIYIDRGLSLVALGRLDEAVDSFAVAVRFIPADADLIDPALRDRVIKRAGLAQ